MKIIDAHAHVVQYIAGFTSRGELRGVGGGRARYADGSEFQMIPKRFGDSFTADDLISVMDKNGECPPISAATHIPILRII